MVSNVPFQIQLVPQGKYSYTTCFNTSGGCYTPGANPKQSGEEIAAALSSDAFSTALANADVTATITNVEPPKIAVKVRR